MNTNSVYLEWLEYMSAPHSDIDALTAHYIATYTINRILAKNHELYARFVSHEPLDEFDECYLFADKE